jgi:Domain of unknown function (DUF1876)./Domain of unknown function (DUF1918).
MKAHQGDRIILAASHIDQATRHGEVIEVRGKDGDPPYLIRWSDGHTGLLYPGPGAILRVGKEHEHLTSVPSPAPGTDQPDGTAAQTAGVAVDPSQRHIREWQVRVSIFESGNATNANVVLLSDAPNHLTARGESHRSNGDPSVPEIGDEVAVARALRHLADQLLETATQDIEALTGEDAFIRPS